MLTMTKTRPVYFRAAKKSVFSTMDVFKGIPFPALGLIEKLAADKKYAKMESIFLEDDDAAFVWFVLEGHVKEVRHSMDGKSQTLSMVGPGGMFGVSAFEGGKYGFHGMAETEARVLSFPIQVFLRLMEKYPALAVGVLSRVSHLLRRSKDMQIFAQESAEKRLLHVLVEMTAEYGLTIPLTRREIAEMAGTAVETCIRAFSRLEKAGFIGSMHGHLTVRSLEGLKKRFEEF